MDDFGAEEALERRNMLKGLHPLMRAWYNTAEVTALRQKYGDFPQFWQDLEQWNHLKILRKVFLTVSEKRESGVAQSAIDVLEIERSFSMSGWENAAAISDVSTDAPVCSSVTPTEANGATKKKRNRWGDPQNDTGDQIPSNSTAAEVSLRKLQEPENDAAVAVEDGAAKSKQQRRSRFSSVVESASDAGSLAVAAAAAIANSVLSQESIQQSLILKMQLQSVNERMMTVVIDAARIEQDPDRSPSPPPKYDSNGKRTNTREIRMRDSLMAERGKIIEELMKMNPAFKPPVDFVKAKPVRRIPIPKEPPGYNFIGLIIGPRGNTQKQMEQETGCKISIRGKGSVKEGSKGRTAKIVDEDEDLHCHVTGDDEEKVEMAAKMVLDLLRPIDDEINAHKQKQLRELALINGTLREDEFCPICGEKGHRQFECPHRAKTFKAAGVKCSICGDLSHPTRDCPLKQGGGTSEVVLDSEYDSFMAALGGGGGGSGTGAVSSSGLAAAAGEESGLAAGSGGGSTSNSSLSQSASTTSSGATIKEVFTIPAKKQTVIHVSAVMPMPGIMSAAPGYPMPPMHGVQASSAPVLMMVPGQGYQWVNPAASAAVPYGQYAAPQAQSYYPSVVGAGDGVTQPAVPPPPPPAVPLPPGTDSVVAGDVQFQYPYPQPFPGGADPAQAQYMYYYQQQQQQQQHQMQYSQHMNGSGGNSG